MNSTRSRGKVSRLAGLICLCLSATLVGCSADGIAYDVEIGELAGSWEAPYEDSKLSLHLSPDGSFTADSWPRNITCSDPSAGDVNAIDWQQTVDFSGTWAAPEADRPYSLLFIIKESTCARQSWSSDVWIDISGTMRLKLFLSSVGDPDDADDDQIFWLTRKED